MRLACIALVVAGGAGCLRGGAFACATDGECGVGGVCETVGYCSFADPSCGRRFGDFAGPYSKLCVNQIGLDGGSDGSGTDGSGTDGPVGQWSTPVKLAGSAVNTSSLERDPSVTADRLTIVFLSMRGGNEDIYLATRTSATAAFGNATDLSALNTSSSEHSPEISPDGTEIHFASNRSGQHEVYRSTLSGGVWGAPSVVSELSSSNDETEVAISPDGLTAMVVRVIGSQRQMMRATRASQGAAFGAPVDIPVLDISSDISAPSVTDNGDAVYFHAGSSATADLYVSHRQGSTYSQPARITELNTSGRDAGPFVNNAEDYIVFERGSDIFETTR